MKFYLRYIFIFLTKWIPDNIYLKLVYFIKTGKRLDFDNLVSYNEKLQYLKLNEKNDLFNILVDKYRVRKYIADNFGEKFLIDLLGVWDNPDDIDFRELPDKFVLKCTHDSGNIIICRDKKKFNIKEAKKRLKRFLKIDYHYLGREWPYKNVKKRIIAEKLMSDEDNEQLKDYKVYTFNGKAKLIQLDYDRFSKHKRNIYDINWNFLDVCFHVPSDSKRYLKKPTQLEKIIEISEKIALKTKHLRVDFYLIKNRIYIGEVTCFYGSGFGRFYPDSINLKMGKWLKL